jgi:Protein of unknown function (DUF2845)
MNRWLTLLVLIAAMTAAHAETLQCGTKLVDEGATRAELVARCGEATQVDHSRIFHQATVWLNGQPTQVGDTVEVLVEVWLYNLGPDKLMRRIRLEDGKIVKIETLGYGYVDDDGG